MQRLSYISTPRHDPYQYRSVGDMVGINAALHPDKEILIQRKLNGERRSLTNAELDRKSTLSYLYSIGVKRNQYVSIVGHCTLEWVIGELAVMKTGAAAVHLSISTSDASDAMGIIENTNCRYILIDPGVDNVMKTLQTLQTRINEWNGKNQDKKIQSFLLRRCKGFKSLFCLEEILGNTINIDLPVVYPENTAVVFTTSGSTGKPKLVQMNHIAIANVWRYILEKDVQLVYNDRPFAWIGGSALTFLVTGIPRVFTDTTSARDGTFIQQVWGFIKEERCTHAFFMPYHLSDMFEYKSTHQSDNYLVQTIFTGGEIVGDICKRVLGLVCSYEVKIIYGSTETGFNALKIIRHDTDFTTGDLGSCLPGVEVKIIDVDRDNTLWGTQGEICIRSNHLSQGYMNTPEWNKELFCGGGWMRTGDIGKISEEGNLFIMGKMKTVISRGTRKLIPALIEEVIKKIPGVKDVVVIPVPDRRLYEEVCACYIPQHDLGTDQINVLCDDLFLKTDAVDGIGEAPTYFVKFGEFPVLHNGKIDKIKVQKIAISYLNIR